MKNLIEYLWCNWQNNVHFSISEGLTAKNGGVLALLVGLLVCLLSMLLFGLCLNLYENSKVKAEEKKIMKLNKKMASLSKRIQSINENIVIFTTQVELIPTWVYKLLPMNGSISYEHGDEGAEDYVYIEFYCEAFINEEKHLCLRSAFFQYLEEFSIKEALLIFENGSEIELML